MGGWRRRAPECVAPVTLSRPIPEIQPLSRLSTAPPRLRSTGPRRQMELPAPCSSTEEKSPNLMSSEITAAEAVAPGHPDAPDPAPAGLWSLTVEAAGAGIRVVEGMGAWVRHRVVGSGGVAGDAGQAHDDEAQPRGLVLRPALLGFGAMLAIAVGASLPSSPFKLEMPGVWFFGVPGTGGASTWGVYFSLAAVYGGLLLLMRVWWGMTRLYSRCPGVPIKRMMWVFALWSLPMLVIAPLFSRDAYSYAAQGEMVSHHMNPYLYGPFELGNNAYTAPVDQLWGNAPAPYGPLFLQIDGFFARVTLHNELATIVLLRLLALVGVLMIAWCVPRLARLLPPGRGRAVHPDGAQPGDAPPPHRGGPQRRPHAGTAGGRADRGQGEASDRRDPAVRPGHGHQGARRARHPLCGLELARAPGVDPGPLAPGGDRRADRCGSARVLLVRQWARMGVGDHPRVHRAWSGRGPRRPRHWPSCSPPSPTSPISGWGWVGSSP